MKERLAEFSGGFWRRTAFLRSGAGLACVVVGLVGLRLFWVQVQRPAHRQEIVAAFSSLNEFYEGAQMNHDGSRFIYVADGKNGSTLFLCDTATGGRQIVREGKGEGQWHNEFNLHAWPWAPDDSSFIFVNDDELVICPADISQPSASLPIAGTNVVSDVVWLNPSEFAFVLDHNILGHAQRQANGQWQWQQYPCNHDLSHLAAIDTHQLAWLENNVLCRIELGDNTNSPFGEPKTTAPAPSAPLARHLVLWLDASTLQQADHSTVEQLDDLSLMHNNATVHQNAPFFNAPDSSGALNGKGTIHFSSGKSLPEATGLKTAKTLRITGAEPRTMFAVMRRDADKSMRISTGNCGMRGEYCGLCDQSYGLWLPAGTLMDNAFPALPRAWNLLSVICDGSSEKGYVNGTLKGTANFAINTADAEVELGVRIARSGDNKRSVGSDGDFAELLIYDRALDMDEQRQVEDYLNAKWFGRRRFSLSQDLVWIDPQMDGIVSFNYCRETGALLVVRNANGHNSLWQFDPKAGDGSKWTEVPSITSIRNVQWLGNGRKEFTYTSSDPNVRGLFLADVSGAENGRLFENGRINWSGVAPDGGKILIIGTLTNEASAGIWQYDPVSRQLQPVVRYSDQPSDLVKRLDRSIEKITLPSGRLVDCSIFPPANFNRHKKYPLIILDSGFFYSFPKWMPPLENCGAYVVVTRRGGWWEGIEQINENIMGAYQYMVQKPNIDVHQVYPCITSAETQYANKLLVETPGLWKGVIFVSPIKLPDFSKSPPFQSRPKILLTAGGKENNEAWLKKYQQDALSHGVVVEYAIYPQDGHVAFGYASIPARIKDIVHFIFEE